MKRLYDYIRSLPVRIVMTITILTLLYLANATGVARIAFSWQPHEDPLADSRNNGLLLSTQDSTNKVLEIMASQPLEPEKPKR